jgi:WD40 repeat protein
MAHRLSAGLLSAGVLTVLGILILAVASQALCGNSPVAEAQEDVKPTSASSAASDAPQQPDPRAPVVIPNCRLVAALREEVPSEHDGRLTVIGTELQPGEPIPPADRLVTVEFAVLVTEAKPAERVASGRLITIKNDPRTYRAWEEGDPILSDRLIVAKVSRQFRRLEVGEVVRAGQVLGLVNPTLAGHDLAIRKAKLDAAEAEHKGAEKIRDYYREHLALVSGLKGRNAATVEEVAEARASGERSFQDVLSKAEAVKVAKAELVQANKLLIMHEIRSSISGVLTNIYKNQGDAAYRLESVFHVQNAESLRIEGWIDVQHLPGLLKGLAVTVEPTWPVRPLRVLRGHLQEVTSVAVSRGPNPVIVSSSEDGTVRVWDAATGLRRQTLRHPVAVRAVACAPSGAAKNLCLSGAADGSARLWDLDALDRPAQELRALHKAAIGCVAFSPDGEWCATGSQDHAICLWKCATGERLCCLAGAHEGEITSLHFASPSRLVSAGRDNHLMVWEVSRDGQPRRVIDLDGRGGAITSLGVSPNGRQLFFDHGPELSLLSLADREAETRAILRNTTKDLNFATLAQFSPGGTVLLTGGAPEGGLLLWRAPTAARPAGELRRLTWPESSATCGAFAPDGSFVVSGTKDRCVLVWGMPSREEVERRLTAQLTPVEPFVGSTGGRARVWAEMKNPGWLVPGGTATMVIPPAPLPDGGQLSASK